MKLKRLATKRERMEAYAKKVSRRAMSGKQVKSPCQQAPKIRPFKRLSFKELRSLFYI